MKFTSSSLFTVATAVVSFASSANAAFEWAGTFKLTDASHTWIMQSVGGSYVDPSMKLVLFSSSSTDQEAIESNESTAESLIDGTCTDVQDGGTISGITDAGSCYNLVVGSTDTSKFTMDTTGVTSLVVFAEHVPVEFERDMHFFQDSAGEDIESVAEEGGDGHAHSHGDGDHEEEGKLGISCACAAEEYSFGMDCTATAAMSDALSSLKKNGCGDDCSSDLCQKNWLIVQTHHDYCDTDAVPSDIEDDFHDFDTKCKSCDISRIESEGAMDCPAANCEDTSGNDAYAFLAENGCQQDCSSDECLDAYRTLRIVHDSCDHDALSTSSEEGLHDFEDVCQMKCNTPESKKDQTVCESSAAAAAISVAAGTVIGIALSMF